MMFAEPVRHAPHLPLEGGGRRARSARRVGVNGAQRRLFSMLALRAIHPTPARASRSPTLPLQGRVNRACCAVGVMKADAAPNACAMRNAGARRSRWLPWRFPSGCCPRSPRAHRLTRMAPLPSVPVNNARTLAADPSFRRYARARAAGREESPCPTS